MRVTPHIARAQGAGVDGGRYRGSSEVIFVEIDCRAHAGEGPFDRHDAHVLGGKLHLGVHRIHRPAHRHSLHFLLVAATTVPIATVCQGTFHCATTVLVFEGVDLPRGGCVSV